MRNTYTWGAALVAAVVAGGLPAGRVEAQDDEDETDAPATPAPAGPAVSDDELKTKVEKALRIRPIDVRDGQVGLTYGFTQVEEAYDWDCQGFDKVDLRGIAGATGGPHGTASTAYELGAGSRAAGRALHKLKFSDTAEVDVEMWLAHNSPSAFVVIGLADKVGVLWGQTLVKPSTLKPWAEKQGPPDLTLFNEERHVNTQIRVTNGMEVTVDCQGKRTSMNRFTKNELKQMRVAIIAKNCRVIMRSLRIKAKVDPATLD
jgi:hypothetical protein